MNKELDLCYNDNWTNAKDSVMFLKREEDVCVFMFITRMNKDLDEVIGRILGKTPLPILQEFFSELRREEAQQGVIMINMPYRIEHESSTMTSKNINECRKREKP